MNIRVFAYMRMAGLGLLAGTLMAQTNLTVTAATNKQVNLSWSGSASSYSVLRAPVGGSFSTIATAAATSYSDTTIDAYTTYQYQVSANSNTSNTVTAGPPAAGFSDVAPTPGAADSISGYGYDLSMVLDGNGDPAFAFVFEDPNQDTDRTDTEILFRSWNRAQYTWNPIVKVGTVGDITADDRLSISLAYDTSTNSFVVASEDNVTDDSEKNLDIFLSTDGGKTWSQKGIIANDYPPAGPSVALSNGNIYLAFNVNFGTTNFYSGKLSSAISTWQIKQLAVPASLTAPEPYFGPSVALDSAGNPAVAVWADDANDSGKTLLFWRPANSTLVKATDTEGNSGSVAVKLLFSGTNPRILFYGQRNDAPDASDGNHFIRSNDGGATWQSPVVIPPDGNASTDYPFDMALDSKDDVAVAYGQNGSSGDSVCGNPKLSLSTDGVNFKTCAAADVSVTGSFQPYPASIQAAYGGNDRLYLLWWQNDDNSNGTGILMYRQPPAGGSAIPAIGTDASSVLNGATNQPGGIVAGSWVAIKGANFSDVTTDWSQQDFSNGLPTSLGGVQVTMNGANAAVYYVSPGQVNVQAPAAVGSGGNVSIQVVRNGVGSNTVNVTSSASAPGLFAYSLDQQTFYPAAVFSSDGVIVGDPAAAAGTRKARAGDRILLFATALGSSPAGSLINAPIPFPNLQVTIGSSQATVEFAGLVAPGEFQINIVVPAGLNPGNQPITIQTGGLSSQSGVVLPIAN